MKKNVYNEKVNEARQIVSMLKLKNNHRMKVAEIAMDVCIVVHGGRAPATRYSLRKFAEDIGMSSQTLSEWCRYKRYIYDKVTPDQRESYHSFSNDQAKELIKGLTADTPVKTVQRKFAMIVRRGSDSKKLQKYARHLQSIIHNVSNHSRLLEVDTETLEMIYAQAGLIRGYLDEEFMVRKHKLKKTVQKPVVDMTKFWHEEIAI